MKEWPSQLLQVNSRLLCEALRSPKATVPNKRHAPPSCFPSRPALAAIQPPQVNLTVSRKSLPVIFPFPPPWSSFSLCPCKWGIHVPYHTSVFPFRLVSLQFERFLPLINSVWTVVIYFTIIHRRLHLPSPAASFLPPKLSFYPFLLHPHCQLIAHTHTHTSDCGPLTPPHAHTLDKSLKDPQMCAPFISISKRATSLHHPSVFLCACLHTRFHEHLGIPTLIKPSRREKGQVKTWL